MTMRAIPVQTRSLGQRGIPAILQMVYSTYAQGTAGLEPWPINIDIMKGGERALGPSRGLSMNRLTDLEWH